MTHIIDDRARRRLVTAEHGAEAELVYDRDGDRRGQGTGGKLVTAALDAARRDGLVVVPWCPFARRWLREHTEAVGDVEIDWRTPPPDPARA
jgi:predicted GNAT family acetyltransferase